MAVQDLSNPYLRQKRIRVIHTACGNETASQSYLHSKEVA